MKLCCGRHSIGSPSLVWRKVKPIVSVCKCFPTLQPCWKKKISQQLTWKFPPHFLSFVFVFFKLYAIWFCFRSGFESCSSFVCLWYTMAWLARMHCLNSTISCKITGWLSASGLHHVTLPLIFFITITYLL